MTRNKDYVLCKDQKKDKEETLQIIQKTGHIEQKQPEKAKIGEIVHGTRKKRYAHERVLKMYMKMEEDVHEELASTRARIS
ncbi:hypothetical protein LJB91_01365 [Bacteroidales bacterium OttesenSCG-928-L03]|nr:hypothetical protein [Bacteroidales bacterium OttesenSCG-928-L03]